jgi:TolA-binding protein
VTLTRDFKETVLSRVKREPEFATALLNEAISLVLDGEIETARLILRDFLNRYPRFSEE